MIVAVGHRIGIRTLLGSEIGISINLCISFRVISKPSVEHPYSLFKGVPPPPSGCCLEGRIKWHCCTIFDQSHCGILVFWRPFHLNYSSHFLNNIKIYIISQSIVSLLESFRIACRHGNWKLNGNPQELILGKIFLGKGYVLFPLQ